MYTTINFKTKKALKETVEHYLMAKDYSTLDQHEYRRKYGEKRPIGDADFLAVTIFQPGPFGGNEPKDGTTYLEGPHYPEPHRWYASATIKDGVVVKVK